MALKYLSSYMIPSAFLSETIEQKKYRYFHGRNRTVALRNRARDLIKVIGQGSKPALVSNRAQAKDMYTWVKLFLLGL